MSFPRLSKIVVCSLLAFCLLSLQSGLVSGETPAFKHSTRHFSIAQTRIAPSSGLTTYLLANNSRPYLDFYFDYMIIDIDIHVSAGKLDPADSLIFSILHITSVNATHACGCFVDSNAMYDDAIYAHSVSNFDTELINASRVATTDFGATNFSPKDLVFQINATGVFELTFYISVDITYYQIDFEVSQDFLDSISDGNEPTDFILYGLLLPLILLSTGVFFIQLFGLGFLIAYIAMFYWLARTVLEEIF